MGGAIPFLVFCIFSLCFSEPIPIQLHSIQEPVEGNITTAIEAGLEIYVNRRIEVTHLGVFDSLSDGLNDNITARIYNFDGSIVKEIVFTPSTPGQLSKGWRFLPLDEPLTFSKKDRFFITASPKSPSLDPIAQRTRLAPWEINSGDSVDPGYDLISFGWARSSDTTGVPTQTSSYYKRYAAATIMFKRVEAIYSLNSPANAVGNDDTVGYSELFFIARKPVMVTHIGAFDSGADGIKSPITVYLQDSDTYNYLAWVTFSPGDDGVLVSNTSIRVKELETPIRLGCNQKLIIASEGYNSDEPLGNLLISNDYGWFFDGGDGDLQFQEPYTYVERNYDTWLLDYYPTYGYAAGMIVYEPLYGIAAPALTTHTKIVKKNVIYMGDGVVPIGIAADPRNGLLYVANWGYIGVYDIRTLQYIRWLPTQYCYAIAVDSDGNVYTTDTGFTEQIIKYDVQGNFVAAFGYGYGDAVGELNRPRGLAVNPFNGDIWVAERYGYRTTVFASNGTVKATFGGDLRGSNYYVGNPYQSTSVVVDPSGHKVYLGDIFNRRVLVWDYNTEEWDRFDNGQAMGNVWNLWADGYGRVFTTEYDDGRLQMLNQCGETIATTNVLADKFVTIENTIYAVDYKNYVYELEIQCEDGYYGPDCNSVCEPCNAEGGTCNGGPHGDGLCSCFPGYIGTDCSILIGRKDIYTSWQYTDPKDLFRTGGVWYPFAVDVDRDDNIYVASYRSDITVAIQVFNNNGTWLRDIPLSGNTPQGVRGLAIDRETGDIYVTYNWLGLVVQLSNNGTLINEWDYGADWILSPASAVFDQNTKMLYFSDGDAFSYDENDNVMLYIQMLNTVTGEWSLIYTEDYSVPHAMGVDFTTKEIYYCDYAYLYRYDNDTKSWVVISDEILLEDYTTPWGGGIAVKDGLVYVTQGPVNVLSVFDRNGTVKQTWGGIDVLEGNQVAFTNPKGIAFDSRHNLIIADAGGRRIVKLNDKYECLPNFYGPKCLQCDCPKNGYCWDGVAKNGSCYCKTLFWGKNCDKCIGGYFPTQDTCYPCPKGTKGVNGTCIPCEPGSYAANLGQTTCNPCPVGRNTTSPGQDSCQPCPAGYFADNEGTTLCSICAVGSYQNLQGQSTCKTCDNGYTDEQGATSCKSCPVNARSNSNSTGCACNPGYYGLESGKGSCSRCVSGANCDSGYLTASPGFWRITMMTEVFHKCPNSDACLGGVQSSCADGYKGILCSVCSPGHYSFGGGICLKCPTSASDSKAILVIIVIFATIALGVVFSRSYLYSRFARGMKPLESSPSVLNPQQIRLQIEEGTFRPLSLGIFKILIGFIQVLSAVTNIIDIQWPEKFLSFTNLLSLINLDFVKITTAECVGSHITYFQNLLSVTIIPVSLIVVSIPITYIVVCIKHQENRVSIATSIIWQNTLLFLFIIYTGVATTILAIYNCKEFEDGSSWLQKDYTIKCHTDEYNSYLVYGGIMTILFVIGFPLLICSILLKYRNSLPNENVETRFGMIYRDFKHKNGNWAAFWEAWDISRKLFLTAVLVFVAKEPAGRISVGLIVSLIALVLHILVEPYTNPFAQAFQTLCLFAIVLLYFGGLMLNVTSLRENHNDAIVSYMAAVVIIIFAVLGALFLLQIVSTSFYLHKKRNKVKKINPKNNSEDTPLEELPAKKSVF